MEKPMNLVTRKDYEAALQVQSAANLRAVLRSMTDIADRADRHDHPVLRLFAEQVMFLTGGMGDHTSYAAAYHIVTSHLGD